MNGIRRDLGLEEAIKLRRTVKTDRMNGKHISDEMVTGLLEMADLAPTHAKTEPWRFIVFGPSQRLEFGRLHASLYKQYTDPLKYTAAKEENLWKQVDNVSHVVICWMKRVPNHKIPEIEEVSAVAAAIQNILLTATSLGIASFWSTGGMAHDPSFHEAFGLGDEDKVIGILYLGYTDDPPKDGIRLIPLSEKIEWRK